MEDKEVGVLWLRLTFGIEINTPLENKAILLIRKLVEERKRRYLENPIHAQHYNPKAELRHVLHDFGIDPKEWKEKP